MHQFYFLFLIFCKSYGQNWSFCGCCIACSILYSTFGTWPNKLTRPTDPSAKTNQFNFLCVFFSKRPYVYFKNHLFSVNIKVWIWKMSTWSYRKNSVPNYELRSSITMHESNFWTYLQTAIRSTFTQAILTQTNWLLQAVNTN